LPGKQRSHDKLINGPALLRKIDMLMMREQDRVLTGDGRRRSVAMAQISPKTRQQRDA
jgi:hypothetical protein